MMINQDSDKISEFIKRCPDAKDFVLKYNHCINFVDNAIFFLYPSENNFVQKQRMLSVETILFYSECDLDDFLNNLSSNNYIFVYSFEKMSNFQKNIKLRFASISDDENYVGVKSKREKRNEKIDSIINLSN